MSQSVSQSMSRLRVDVKAFVRSLKIYFKKLIFLPACPEDFFYSYTSSTHNVKCNMFISVARCHSLIINIFKFMNEDNPVLFHDIYQC